MSTVIMSPSQESIFNWNYWDMYAQPPPFIQLSCMMPNSIFLILTVQRDMTLTDVKNILWSKAKGMPLSDHLLSESLFIFEYVNRLGKSQNATDESIRLRDLKPFGGVLRLQRRCLDNDGVAELNGTISSLIGKDLREFDALKSDEVDHFRAQINEIAQAHADSRLNLDPKNPAERLLQLYPNRLAASGMLPVWLQSRLGGNSRFTVDIKWDGRHETTLTLNVAYNSTPRKLLQRILKRYREKRNANLFLLKVCGQSEYLTRDNYPLIRFIYIQEALGRDAHPKFVVVEKVKVSRQLDEEYQTSMIAFAKPTLKKLVKLTVPSWKIKENFKCTVLAVSRLNIDVTKLSDMNIEVHAGIFHGGKPLCGHHVTCNPDMSGLSKGVVRWTEEITFDLHVCDIPRMARLCFAVVEKIKGTLARKNKKYDHPIAWVNTTIFEYNDQLKMEKTTNMHMWEYPNDARIDGLLYPLGTVALNPSADQSVTMTISYGRYSTDSPISYVPNHELNISMKKLALNSPVINPKFVKKINQMKLNPFNEMHEQDYGDLWAMRMFLPKLAPELLPKLLQCTEWNNQENVACVNHLLNSWPPIRVECALELLDYAHAELAVRQFAVERLKDLSDDQLSLYLLQLIHALKHESYLMCDLAIFLLKRAHKNLKIGHFVFWQLKSEMHNPCVNIRFGLLLEGYLRGNQHHLPVLMRQVNCLQKLIDISDMLRKKKDIDSARTEFIKYLDEKHFSEALTNFTNALNPSIKCRCIIPEKCRVMDSKMRPMLLVFDNCDIYGEDIRIIMKKGDDLRQDMFTLQMMRIMDQLWKDEGYDFRLNAYGCISMGDQVGMIEVVLDAQTIANIQKEKGSIGIRSDSIYSWLKCHNPDKEALQKAVSEFMWSCAGYCVATYVLGVGDRHSDNIMVKKNGQLFHIDFGHILGNFKSKLGFRSERVPFVLAREFVSVINGGEKQSMEFNNFRKLCEQAYLVLRRHGVLIVSLFSMMISTGLPELNSAEHLGYLKETLALDVTEEEAQAHFHSKFDEALKNWCTMLHWLCHNIARNN